MVVPSSLLFHQYLVNTIFFLPYIVLLLNLLDTVIYNEPFQEFVLYSAISKHFPSNIPFTSELVQDQILQNQGGVLRFFFLLFNFLLNANVS